MRNRLYLTRDQLSPIYHAFTKHAPNVPYMFLISLANRRWPMLFRLGK